MPSLVSLPPYTQEKPRCCERGLEILRQTQRFPTNSKGGFVSRPEISLVGTTAPYN